MGKIVVLILVVGIATGVWRFWSKIAPQSVAKQSVVPGKINLPGSSNNSPNSGGGESTGFAAANNDAGCSNKPEIRLLGYAWNGQMGMLLASGGAQATQGSLMCKYGVNFRWSRQDDNSKLQEALVTFATELSQGVAQPTKGAHFITMMGDGSATFLKGLNDALSKLGPGYQAKIINAIGYSRGEDKFMGPPAWKTTPSASKGGVVAGVLRDGDWNIALKWLGDNGLPNNPDEKTYDPDALNWIATNDYLDAAEKYITGYTEKREIVRNGKRTGEYKNITVDGVVTWTPGDVNVAEKKGGLVSIVSTREYASQMPCVVIGIDKWMKANRSTVEGMIRATADGGQQIKNSDAALQRGAAIEAKLFNEPGADAKYWATYFKGVTKKDAKGLMVELGGSSVNNLADSLFAFGLTPGSSDLVGTTYQVFGDLVVSQYPELVPSIPPASEVIDRSYLQGVQRKISLPSAVIAKAKPVYRPQGRKPSRLVARRQWNIQFNAGKATFTPQTLQTLERLSRDLLIAGGTLVEVHGHTDNSGDPRTSMPLSAARAAAVRSWLQRRSPANFPSSRIRSYAHGESQPLVPNTSQQNRSKNRRVEIVLRAA